MPTLLPAPVLAALVLLSPAARAQDAAPAWPEYRGPHHDGDAGDADLPLHWSEKENVRWKTAIPGLGWSSPVVCEGRIWLTTATEGGKHLLAVAVDAASGAILHQRRVFDVAHPEHKNALNSYASPSPVVEPGRVYVHFGSYGTACLDAETGETRWQRRDLPCDHMEGPGSSPILWRDLLVVPFDGVDVQYVVALDKDTGKTRWKTARSADLEALDHDRRKAYSTPLVLEVDGAPHLVCSGAQETVAYAPDTGRELWKVHHGGFSMSSRPIAAGGLLFLNTGFMHARLFAVRPGGHGDVTDHAVVWTSRRGIPTIPSPLYAGGRLYLVQESGIVSCLDAATGDRLGHKRIGGQHCASPIRAKGRLYFFDRDGTSVVLTADPELGELARNHLDDGFMASPAVLGNALILRTKSHLYRIEDPR